MVRLPCRFGALGRLAPAATSNHLSGAGPHDFVARLIPLRGTYDCRSLVASSKHSCVGVMLVAAVPRLRPPGSTVALLRPPVTARRRGLLPSRRQHLRPRAQGSYDGDSGSLDGESDGLDYGLSRELDAVVGDKYTRLAGHLELLYQASASGSKAEVRGDGGSPPCSGGGLHDLGSASCRPPLPPPPPRGAGATSSLLPLLTPRPSLFLPSYS